MRRAAFTSLSPHRSIFIRGIKTFADQPNEITIESARFRSEAQLTAFMSIKTLQIPVKKTGLEIFSYAVHYKKEILHVQYLSLEFSL